MDMKYDMFFILTIFLILLTVVGIQDNFSPTSFVMGFYGGFLLFLLIKIITELPKRYKN